MAKKSEIDLNLNQSLENNNSNIVDIIDDSRQNKSKDKKETKKSRSNSNDNDSEDLQQDFFNALQDVMGDKLSVNSMDIFDPVPFFISTGSYAINWIISNDMLNGGFPATKLSLIVGESGKGKSLMATVALGNNIKQHGGHSINIDVEESVNSKEFLAQIVGSEEIAKQIRFIGASRDKNGNIMPITVEKLASIYNKLIDFQMSSKYASKSLCVLTDSFSALTTKKEYEDTRADKDTRDMTAQQTMRRTLRVVTQSLRHANMTLIGIGQMTANINTGVLFAPKTKMSVKGSGPEYWSSLILQMISDKEIINAKTGVPVGIKMRLKTTKNRIKFKGRSAWLHFYFKRGIDPYGGLPELLATYGIFKASSKPSKTFDYSPTTTFTYETHDKNGNEIKLKFKASEFKRIVEENGGEAFIKKLNDELNAVYEDTLDSQNIEELLSSDDFEDVVSDDEYDEEGDYDIDSLEE